MPSVSQALIAPCAMGTLELVSEEWKAERKPSSEFGDKDRNSELITPNPLRG